MSIVVFLASQNRQQELLEFLADVSVARLASLGVRVEGSAAELSDAIHGDVVGVVFCAHGNEWAVYGHDGQPLLDAASSGQLSGTWVHALACLCGVELAGQAVHAGVKCFAGYTIQLIVDFDPNMLAPPVRAALAALVCSTTQMLHDGEVDELAFQRQARHRLDAVQDAILQSGTDDDRYVGIFAGQLARRLVVRSA